MPMGGESTAAFVSIEICTISINWRWKNVPSISVESGSKVHSYVSIAHSIFVFLQVSGYELISFGKFCCTIATLGAKEVPGKLFMRNRGNVVRFSALKSRSFVSIFRMMISAYLFLGGLHFAGL